MDVSLHFSPVTFWIINARYFALINFNPYLQCFASFSLLIIPFGGKYELITVDCNHEQVVSVNMLLAQEKWLFFIPVK